MSKTKSNSVARQRCAELDKQRPALESRRALAASKVEEREAAVAERQKRLEHVENAYVADESAPNARDVKDARDELALAELRLRAPRAELGNAEAALVEWEANKVEAETQLAEAQAIERHAELRERASLETFNSRTAAHFEKLLNALGEVQAAATEIDAAWNDSLAASKELGEEDGSGLARLHLIAPFIRQLVERRGAARLLYGNQRYFAVQLVPNGLAQALTSPLDNLQHFAGTEPDFLPESEATALLDSVLACRTWREGDALIASTLEARKKALADAARKGATRPKFLSGVINTLLGTEPPQPEIE